MSKYYVQLEGEEFGFEIAQGAETTEVRLLDSDAHAAPVAIDLAAVHSSLETGEGLYSLIVEGKSYQMSLTKTEEGLQVIISGHRVDLRVLTEREWRLEKTAPKQAIPSGPLTIKSSMPGLVKEVLVSVGDVISQGGRLLILEAMKMENEIMAIKPGQVTEVHVQQGDTVGSGAPLVTIE